MEGVELLEGEQFVPIRCYENYYISNKGRCYNTKTKNFVRYNNGNGYIRVNLGHKDKYLMHRLVMEHFGPPKPDGDYEIDHVNRIRDDNRIENLRWITKSNNGRNKSSNGKYHYEYFDEIPVDDVDDIIDVRDYGPHEFENYYYADGFFYYDTGDSFRRLHINYRKNGSAFVCMKDKENKTIQICYTVFKKIYGLN